MNLESTIQAHDDRAWCVTWHPQGKILASCSSDKKIKIWEGNECVRTFEGHQKTVRALAWNQDGSRLASASFDGTTCIWNLQGELL